MGLFAHFCPTMPQDFWELCAWRMHEMPTASIGNADETRDENYCPGRSRVGSQSPGR